mmetsp:Transcript_20470/g.44336  ORF Transcript_20470/g.44336 Transcript_20470/m.44336 type:complete len:181 (+) Transcript_20470:56-598(+)|eukprot:CAMPEP_0168743910 /NCGR_PEP_ID=MMETSP0724-20121128/13821_1 /TAXON_ID=265536 /ORGANISM="Amphiprora sp., Strain CCMP467" /LENGTH=180 /DNA_ID=CAMNT_0008791557 /DNA_START=54 /DNA_END=596 /DNA_ORIENTATION=+
MISHGEIERLQDRTCRRKGPPPTTDGKSLAQRKREHEEALAYAKECQAIARQRQQEEAKIEMERQNTIPYAADTLTDLPVEQRQALRKARLQQIKHQRQRQEQQPSSSSPSQEKPVEPTYVQEMRQDARDQATYKTLKELKQALKDRDIPTDSFVEKNDFVEAYVDAIVGLKLKALAASS